MEDNKMKTLPCGIYEYASPAETNVVFFFEVQEEDDYELVGWAKFDRSRKGWLKRPPVEAHRFVNELDLPTDIDECWQVVYDQTPEEYPYIAKIDGETVNIYENGKHWLTLTNLQPS